LKEKAMNCQEFERDWAELENYSQFTDGMRAHRLVCRHCSEMVEDIFFLTEQARRIELAEPPDRLWVQIRQRMEQEGIIRQPKPRWFSAPAPGRWFRLPAGLAYAAYGAVFVVAVGVMYVQSLLTNPAAPPMLAVSPRVPETAFIQTQRDPNIEELVQKLPPERRATFVSNWNQVNSSIDAWNDFLRENPGDSLARDARMNAVQQREHLREGLVRWEEF
jgi:hypothetical protein